MGKCPHTQLLPSAPNEVEPHAHRVPSRSSANAWSSPAVIDVTVRMSGSCSGGVDGSESSHGRPQLQTVPSRRSAITERPVPAIETASDIVLTRTGTDRAKADPSASSPLLFSPQPQITPLAAPPASIASEYRPCASIAMTPPRPSTRTGVVREVVVPSPICPIWLQPQAQTVPSDFKASEWL